MDAKSFLTKIIGTKTKEKRLKRNCQYRNYKNSKMPEAIW